MGKADAPSGAGISVEDGCLLDNAMKVMLDKVERGDPLHRPRHYVLFVLTREGEAEDGEDVISFDTISSLDRPYIKQVLRDWWLHDEVAVPETEQ